MLPVRRDLEFQLPAERVLDWHPAGAHVTTFFNTLSLFFPVGERFFIHSVRHYRDRITDPDLQKQVAGFIGQEAMHGREHEDYNERAAAAGLPIKAAEAKVARYLDWIKRTHPPRLQLSATIALEHLTAILADILLREPRLIDGADEHYRALWLWHALEETEHKAVAYDVYREVMGRSVRGYFLRVTGFLTANVIFWILCTRFLWWNLRAQNQQWNLKGWWSLFKFHWLSPGGLRRIVPAWLDYFRPGFHPWDHDNRDQLERVRAIAERYATGGLPTAA